MPDLKDIKGQETAKRALEVAAAGGHNLLMIGPPGAGKSMLARRLPSILPPLEPSEMLEVSMIRSLAGDLAGGRINRPFRAPLRHPRASRAMCAARGACAERYQVRDAPRQLTIRLRVTTPTNSQLSSHQQYQSHRGHWYRPELSTNQLSPTHASESNRGRPDIKQTDFWWSARGPHIQPLPLTL